jgi:hypothetical protein
MGRARYLVVIAAAAALVGCGDDSAPDLGVIERDLAAGVEEDTGTRDVTVECPEDLEEGDVCQVTAAGGVRAEVRVTGLDGEAEGTLVQP